MIVDFHVHSTASDGTYAPAELAEKAAKNGFAAIALTDHDNCDGQLEFASAPIGASACRRITGVELSIDPGVGFDKFHLLALAVDASQPAFRDFLRRILEGRNARNERIVANFARLGIEMSDIASYSHGEVLARPHFARWLVDHGFVSSIAEGFEKYLLPESPHATRCYEERFHPSQEETFAVVHAAGGLCVMAHPKYWRRHWKDCGCNFADAEKELAALKEKGLDGLESIYAANTVEESVFFTRMANKIGLLKSAGSDFHGQNKPAIGLGMEVQESFIRPLLENL